MTSKEKCLSKNPDLHMQVIRDSKPGIYINCSALKAGYRYKIFNGAKVIANSNRESWAWAHAYRWILKNK